MYRHIDHVPVDFGVNVRMIILSRLLEPLNLVTDFWTEHSDGRANKEQIVLSMWDQMIEQ